MSGSTRTLAFQVSEELFQRVKEYLSKHRHLTQKSFVVGLIEAELNQYEALEARVANRLDARDGVQPEEGGGEPQEGGGEPQEGDGEPQEGDGEPQEGDGEPQEGDRPTGEE